MLKSHAEVTSWHGSIASLAHRADGAYLAPAAAPFLTQLRHLGEERFTVLIALPCMGSAGGTVFGISRRAAVFTPLRMMATLWVCPPMQAQLVFRLIP